MGLSPRLSALRRRLECSTLYRPVVSSGGEAVGVGADVEDAHELSAAGHVSAGDPFADGALVYAGEGCGCLDVDPYVSVAAGNAEEPLDVPVAFAGSAVDRAGVDALASGYVQDAAAFAVVGDGGAGDAPPAAGGVGVPSADGLPA